MTLLDLAEHVCGKLLKSDDASLEKAKDYLRFRHKLIWDAFLWKDSIITIPDVPLHVNPQTGDYRSELILPDPIARPILAWPFNDSGDMTPGELVDLARIGTDGAAKAGGMLRFVELSATGVPVPAGTGTCILQFTASSTDDYGSEIGIQYSGERGEELWGATNINLYSDKAKTVTLNPGVALHTADFFVGRMTKPVTAGYVTVGAGTILGLTEWRWPAESTVAEFARIRLVDRPTMLQYGAGFCVGVLGKRKPRSFVRDTDSPALRGCENALIALATGDMLERDRMYAKAQAKFSEGDAMIRVMKDGEVNQSAHVARIVPEEATAAGCRDDFGW